MLGEELVENDIELVYGGGTHGMMGSLAAAMLRLGGRVTGVIPTALLPREGKLEGMAKVIQVRSMHERKATMERLSDAFIALPGGMGTFEELCEIITWQQLGLHQKPVVVYNADGYFDPLLQMFDRAVECGFSTEEQRRGILEISDPGGIVSVIRTADVPEPPHYIWPETS